MNIEKIKRLILAGIIAFGGTRGPVICADNNVIDENKPLGITEVDTTNAGNNENKVLTTEEMSKKLSEMGLELTNIKNMIQLTKATLKPEEKTMTIEDIVRGIKDTSGKTLLDYTAEYEKAKTEKNKKAMTAADQKSKNILKELGLKEVKKVQDQNGIKTTITEFKSDGTKKGNANYKELVKVKGSLDKINLDNSKNFDGIGIGFFLAEMSQEEFDKMVNTLIKTNGDLKNIDINKAEVEKLSTTQSAKIDNNKILDEKKKISELAKKLGIDINKLEENLMNLIGNYQKEQEQVKFAFEMTKNLKLKTFIKDATKLEEFVGKSIGDFAIQGSLEGLHSDAENAKASETAVNNASNEVSETDKNVQNNLQDAKSEVQQRIDNRNDRNDNGQQKPNGPGEIPTQPDNGQPDQPGGEPQPGTDDPNVVMIDMDIA